MELKYAVRSIDPLAHHGPTYLQKTEYGLQFTFHASQPYELHYFECKEDALKYMEEHFKCQWFEIVEVYVV